MTDITLSPAVHTRVVRVDGESGLAGVNAAEVLHEPALLVIDGLEWPALASVRQFREKRERAYDSPFAAGMPPVVAAALEPFYAALDALFDRLYGGVYARTATHRAWRPAVSRNEPLHFDTRYVAGEILVTAFLNVADTPREYGVSHTLPRLCRTDAAAVRACCKKPYTPASVPLDLRHATLAGRGPMSAAAPRHIIKFAPGAVWFFDPKRVSHELRFGECAVSCGWPVQVADRALLPEHSLLPL